MSDPYHIDKPTQQISFLTDSGLSLPPSGTLFLPPEHTHSAKTTALWEFLNSEKGFLPIRLEGGTTVMMNKHHLQAVFSDDCDRGEFEAIGLDPLNIRVHLKYGTTFEGDTYLQMPSERGRLSDLLNRNEPFLLLFQSNRTVLVNKAFVVSAAENTP
jgi:hypothetical protein